VAVSTGSRGRATDNVFIERLWRRVKYEEIYLKDYAPEPISTRGLRGGSTYTRTSDPPGLGYRTPYEVFSGLERHIPKSRSQHKLDRSRLPISSL